MIASFRTGESGGRRVFKTRHLCIQFLVPYTHCNEFNLQGIPLGPLPILRMFVVTHGRDKTK